jgi:hypothetical protein
LNPDPIFISNTKQSPDGLFIRVNNRGLQRDVVYLGLPITPSYEPKCGGRGAEVAGSEPMSPAVYTGAKLNFGDLVPYLFFVFALKILFSLPGLTTMKS